MAKRRKTATKRHSPRRRRKHGLGAIDAGGIITGIAGVAVGAAVAGILVKQVLGSQGETIKMIAPVALGIAVPMFLKSDLGKSVGHGMIAVGVLSALHKANIVSGIEDALHGLTGGSSEIGAVEVTLGDLPNVGGYDAAMAGEDVSLHGNDDLPVISGYMD